MKTKIFTLSIGFITSLFSFTYAQSPGDLDQGFGINGTVITATQGYDIESFQDIAIQDDQKIVAVGNNWDSNYTGRIRAMRFMPNGSPDFDFGVDGVFTYEFDNEALAYSCAINDAGKIILAGATTNYQGYRVLLIQLNANGTLDDSFGENGVVVQQLSTATENSEDFALGVTLDAEGNILISGNSHDAEYLRRPFVARFSTNGILDTDFGVDGIATIPVVESINSFDCITVQPDGKILAAGTYSPQFLWNVMLLVRFNADGTLDTSFGNEGIIKYSHNNVDDEVFNMALSPDGNIVLAGFSATVTYEYYALLVQFTADGILDTSFGTDGYVLENEQPYNEGADLKIESDGKIILAGTSGDAPPGGFDMAVWKYNADGTRDAGFGVNGLAKHTLNNYYVMLHGIALQADNKIVGVGQARTTTNDNDYIVVRLENDISSGINDTHYATAPSLWPNPASASSEIQIQFSEPLTANSTLEFYSITGKLLISTPVNNIKSDNQSIITTIPTNLNNGVYLVRVSQNGTQSFATKLVVLD